MIADRNDGVLICYLVVYCSNRFNYDLSDVKTSNSYMVRCKDQSIISQSDIEMKDNKSDKYLLNKTTAVVLFN